ncbi:MAG TPA: IS110 family transposase [Parvularculaceae bacterium]|nr:IS110 family transposase [Parvularculaceae bacterium]
MTENMIGVDIAKDWIDVFDGCSGERRRIKSAPQALKGFARVCAGKLVVFEASGGYERPLINALEDAQAGFARINPRCAREFARATCRLAKTDRVDAELLARRGAALGLKADPPRDEAADRLAMLIARRDALVEHRKQDKQRLQQAMDAFIAKDIASLIVVFARRIAKIEAEIAAHIANHDHLKRRNEQLRSVPGVGPVVAATLLAKLPELGRINRRAIANLAGLAPPACDSGQMRGKRMIWGGRAEVRRALYAAAFIASRHEPGSKAYRQKLNNAGKPFKVAIVACARRLLTQINACVRDGRPYDANHL